jgi:hypothetical protein
MTKFISISWGLQTAAVRLEKTSKRREGTPRKAETKQRGDWVDEVRKNPFITMPGTGRIGARYKSTGQNDSRKKDVRSIMWMRPHPQNRSKASIM